MGGWAGPAWAGLGLAGLGSGAGWAGLGWAGKVLELAAWAATLSHKEGIPWEEWRGGGLRPIHDSEKCEVCAWRHPPNSVGYGEQLCIRKVVKETVTV